MTLKDFLRSSKIIKDDTSAHFLLVVNSNDSWKWLPFWDNCLDGI